MLDQLTDETNDTLLAQHAASRAPVHELHLHHGGGAMSRAPAGGTAFAHRNAAYVLNIISRSPEREGFEEHVDWARATHKAMDPWSTGGYVNFTSEPGQDKVQESYPPDTYARLVAVGEGMTSLVDPITTTRASGPLTCWFGAPGRTRTCTLRIRSRLTTVHAVFQSAVLAAQVESAVQVMSSCRTGWSLGE
jgi:hypothetical protein